MIHPGVRALNAILNHNDDQAENLLHTMTVPDLDKLIDAIDKLGTLADHIAIQKLDGEK